MATGYRINELPDVQPPYSALANAYFEAEAPTGAAGAYTNQRLRGDKLTEWLKTAVGPDNRAPNQRPNLRFIVRTLAERDALDPLKMCLGATCQVQEPKVQEYVLLYTPHTASTFYTHKTGDFTADLTDAAWYKADAPAVGVPAYPQFAADYVFAVDQLVRAYVSGNTTELFFAAKAATVLPAPSNAAGDANWRLVAAKDVPPPSGPTTTDGLPEGTTNLYFTDARAKAASIDKFNYRGNWTTNTAYAKNDVVKWQGIIYFRPTSAFTSGASFDKTQWIAFGAGLSIDYQNELVAGANLTTPGTRTAANFAAPAPAGQSILLSAQTLELYSMGSLFDYNPLFGRIVAIRNAPNATGPATLTFDSQPNKIDGSTADLSLQPGEWIVLKADYNAGGYTKVMRGTLGSGSSTTTLVLDSADPNRVSKGIPVTAVFQISAETLDVNAASIAYQLDTNTRTTRVYGSPDQTRAQINTQLAALTATQMSEGAKLYVKTVPTVTANPSTIILTLQ